MQRRATFVLLLLCGGSAAGALMHAAQQADAPAYDIALMSSREGQTGIYRMRGDGTQPSPWRSGARDGPAPRSARPSP